MLVYLVTLSLLFVHNVQSGMMATARINSDSTNSQIGYLIFTQNDDNSPVVIKGKIWNMTSNTVHGFHVHKNPLPKGEYNCTETGPHFNPYDTVHGPITANIMNRHVGDLGNVISNNAGLIDISIQDSIIQLYNATQSIVKRTIVLHAMRDDGGTGGFVDSTTIGNAGARIACGNIKFIGKWPVH